MSDTRFIQISDYCMVEYAFNDLVINTTQKITDNFICIRENAVDQNQIYNVHTSHPNVKNIQDVSAIYIGNNNHVSDDIDYVPNYSDYNTDITKTTIVTSGIPYDTVRFHFVTGFSFTEFDNLLLAVANQQNNGLLTYFSNIMLNAQTLSSLVVYNPRPMFLSDVMYDRYVEFRIPSIKWINQEYYTAVDKSTTFASKITPKAGGGYSGFVENAPIHIILRECDAGTDIVNEDHEDVIYPVWSVQEEYEAVIPQLSRFDNLGLVIQEAADGDYLEYYATVSGQFPDEFIADLEKQDPTSDWVIVHQLAIYEQIGSSFINTKKLVDIQEDRFDEPNIFRPVLENADSAVSYSVDYLYRFMNRTNGEQYIRTGSYSSFNTKKYGRKIQPIALAADPQSHAIYNKIVNNNNDVTMLFMEPSIYTNYVQNTGNATVVEKNVYLPVYFNVNRINVSTRTVSVSNSGKEQDVIFKQGALRLLLTPFDNIFKFKIYEVVDGIPSPLNLGTNVSYNISFALSGTEVYTVSNTNDPTLENLTQGEVAFKIDKKNAMNILNKDVRTFYITTVAADSTETIVYTGQWNNSSEIDQIQSANETAATEAQNNATTTSATTTTQSGVSSGSFNIPGVIPAQPDDKNQGSVVYKTNPPVV